MEDTLYLDFPDIPAFQILALRYQGTATILGIKCDMHSARFGADQIHMKMVISGEEVDVNRFVEFVNYSMDLL